MADRVTRKQAAKALAMAVKVSFEIGHTAKLKSKKTPEGFTHDWELYVRGVEKCDISHFVDKVVFNLHDSFPKPKRTYKEAPYILKESGYAGFVLPIDIYFKNRDDPKRVQYSYDLDLQNTGPPVHRSVVKKFIFHSPSEEFKQKLLKGGGSLLIMNYDEKSRDSAEERTQVAKPKATIEAIKKHKIRTDDSKIQTFATLFGTPITKTSTKVSPDPKSKGSPGLATSSKVSNKAPEKSSTISAVSVKEKVEKIDKKDKHRRNSPHKERDSSKDSKKAQNDEKHERKDEKVKEKSHSKDRERSKDRALKRPISPKRTVSPKRPSPPRSSSAASREENNTTKPAVKPDNTDIKKTSSNSGKKSKKEKKSHDKDKDRERKERDRERKDKEDRSSCSNVSLGPTPVGASHISNTPAKAPASEPKSDPPKKEGQPKDPKELKKVENKTTEVGNTEKKVLEKHEKDSEKKHKHKKKDKSKDKEKDVSSKDKKKEKSNKQKDENRKVPQPSPQMSDSLISAQQKSNSNSISNSTSKLSDQDSSDSDNESSLAAAPEVKQNNNHSDTSNSSFPDLVVPKPAVPQFEEVKSEKKDHKGREKTRPEKESKKRKRKSKDDPEPFNRKSVSPIVNPDLPPNKQIKKEDVKDDKPGSPLLSGGLNSNQPAPHDASPRITNSSPVFRTPSSAPISMSLAANNSNDRGSTNVDYMSELRELQHKIMTLQDNNELQQVVEMIAATGRFEMTSKTFDFDLCALDRTTVQRLQDFLATSVS